MSELRDGWICRKTAHTRNCIVLEDQESARLMAQKHTAQRRNILIIVPIFTPTYLHLVFPLAEYSENNQQPSVVIQTVDINHSSTQQRSGQNGYVGEMEKKL